MVAIENQLGLKYLCGAPEDHTGRPYDGVQDLYCRRGVQTVGRAELAQLLAQAGFGHIPFQYPFPDYKLPAWVLTQRGLAVDGSDPCAILRLVNSVHDGKATRYTAEERPTRPGLHRNGPLSELSNSFLVLASLDADARQLFDDDLLVVGAVTDRQPAFNTQSRITAEGDGRILVHKRRLIPSATSPGGQALVHQPGSEAYRTGKQVEQLAVEALTRDGIDAAVAVPRRWVDHLLAVGLASRDSADLYAWPPKPEFFDCNPQNLIATGEALHLVDKEWQYHGVLPVRSAVLRYLKPFASREEALLRKHFKSRAPLSLQLARRLGVSVTKAQYQSANQLRRALNALTRAAASPARREGSTKKRGGSRWGRLRLRAR